MGLDQLSLALGQALLLALLLPSVGPDSQDLEFFVCPLAHFWLDVAGLLLGGTMLSQAGLHSDADSTRDGVEHAPCIGEEHGTPKCGGGRGGVGATIGAQNNTNGNVK